MRESSDKTPLPAEVTATIEDALVRFIELGVEIFLTLFGMNFDNFLSKSHETGLAKGEVTKPQMTQ